MSSMTVIFGAAAVLMTGAFIAYSLFILLAGKFQAPKAGIETAVPAQPQKLSGKQQLDNVLKVLSENPRSKAAVKIKIYAAIVSFALAMLAAPKFIFAALIGLGVFAAIGWYFNKQIKKKMELFDNQLIEALGMVTNSVRAGQSLMQALENMVKDTKDPISAEFESALRQVKLGVPLNSALDEICVRIKSKDLKIVVTSINLARETGGNLGEILSRIADTMRERKKIKGKIDSLTAQGRMSGTVMGAVPFLLLAVLYLIEPEMMGLLFTTILGNLMLTVAVVMVSLGMLVINKIINIDI